MLVISCFLCTYSFSLNQQDPKQEKEIEALSKLPRVISGEYRCEEWVETINYLRRLGKEKSLNILKAYFAKSSDHERIKLACRLLFVNPKGWEVPKLGAPSPLGIDTQAIKKHPLFPFAVSEGVPFVVVSGYRIGGKIGGGKECLEMCENLEMVKKDYSTTGWEKAAQKLVQSENFLQLYPGGERKRMIEIIMTQAKKPEKR